MKAQKTMPVVAWLAMAAMPFIAGCTMPGAQRDSFAAYDFGPPAASAKVETAQSLRQPLVLFDVQAPAWMDVPSIHYRLAYVDVTRPLAYANSRWVMPPQGLFANRLRQRLAAISGGGILLPAEGVRAPHSLRVELDEFAQIFDSAERSRAVVKMRVTLVGSRNVVAQRSFSVERDAPSPNAEGGVRALTAASDAVIAEITDWLAASIK
ncbi:MAG: hypothetical protein EXR27_20445 [Betaproteobacteria bacterium]|nr:hypothetical protein [Betaproteobacteria bacterium]